MAGRPRAAAVAPPSRYFAYTRTGTRRPAPPAAPQGARADIFLPQPSRSGRAGQPRSAALMPPSPQAAFTRMGNRRPAPPAAPQGRALPSSCPGRRGAGGSARLVAQRAGGGHDDPASFPYAVLARTRPGSYWRHPSCRASAWTRRSAGVGITIVVIKTIFKIIFYEVYLSL